MLLRLVITTTANTKIYTLYLHDALPISFDTLPTRYSPQVPVKLSGSSPSQRVGRSRWSGASGSGRMWASNEGSKDRKSTRLNSSHVRISYAVFCLKKKKYKDQSTEIYYL